MEPSRRARYGNHIRGGGPVTIGDFYLKKNNPLYLVVLLVVTNAIACNSTAITRGTSPIVGVKPGDVSLYGYNVTLFSNETSPILSTHPYYQWFSSVHSCLVLVENVSDNNITAQFTYMYRNGATDTITRWVNLGIGGASDSEAAKGYFTVVNATFNETLTKTYLGVDREAGHLFGGFLGVLMWTYNETEYTLPYNYTLDFYADMLSGTLLEYTETISNRNGTYFSEMACHVIITQSNIVPESLPRLILPALMMAALLLAFLDYEKKHNLTRADQSSRHWHSK